MQQQEFKKLNDLSTKWLAEADTILSELIPPVEKRERAKALLDCAEALNNTLMEITDSEKELILSNH